MNFRNGPSVEMKTITRLLLLLPLACASLEAQNVKFLTDKYGGWIGTCVTGSASGYWHTEKISDRWWIIDPLGNPFWMKGVYDVQRGGGGYDDFQHDTTNLLISRKYAAGNSQYFQYNWAATATRRLRAWGFNTLADYCTNEL